MACLIKGVMVLCVLLVGALAIIGCTAGEDLVYAGAPVVSIKTTDSNAEDFIQVFIDDSVVEHTVSVWKYRLEAQESLSYDITVNLKATHYSTDPANSPTESFVDIKMKEGRSVVGEQTIIPKKTSILILSIMPWDGLGDAAYNVGSPNSITVER